MAGKNKKKKTVSNIAAQNRKARHDYFIDEVVEAGIMLLGTEVKSLREGRGSLTDCYAAERKGELWLFNAHIGEYSSAARDNHPPLRPRKLLLHRRELAKLTGAANQKGMTLIPLNIHFNSRGIAKVDLALARGKAKYDKRATLKEREWQRDKARLMREKG